MSTATRSIASRDGGGGVSSVDLVGLATRVFDEDAGGGELAGASRRRAFPVTRVGVSSVSGCIAELRVERDPEATDLPLAR